MVRNNFDAYLEEEIQKRRIKQLVVKRELSNKSSYEYEYTPLKYKKSRF